MEKESGDHFPRSGQQHRQHPKRLVLQTDLHPALAQLSRREIDLEIPKPN